MKQLTVIGDYFGQIGYSAHTKNLVTALSKIDNLKLSLVTNLPQNFYSIATDKELEMIKNDSSKSDAQLLILLPPQAKQYLCEDKINLLYCIWEGDKIRQDWLEILLDDRVNYILCPSHHIIDAIINTIIDSKYQYFLPHITKKIIYCPHGVDTSLFYNDKSRELRVQIEQEGKDLQQQPFDNKLTFITSGGWVNGIKDRKGISYLVKAFLEEFTPSDNVRLIVKANVAYGVNIDKNLEELQIQKDVKDYPELQIIAQNVEYKDLNKFYNMGDVYVNTSLAEGFCLGPLEAMACEKPVLTTNFGGQMEYCNNANSWILEEGCFHQVYWDVNYEGVRWKYPSLEEIKEALRYIYNNQNEIKQKGEEAYKTALIFNWNVPSKIIYDLL